MIRRDAGRDWLLVSQVEHARLAADVAAAWTQEPLPRPDLLTAAVREHDDGWREWEQAPQVHPETGVPRDFTEMPMAVSTAIWTRSIATCADQSPLGGLWVSRHFCWLAEKAREHRHDRPDEVAAVESYLSEQADRQREWTAQAAAQVGNDLDSLIESGFRFVQFFDRLSLWLCCAERTAPQEFDVPGGGRLRLTPLAAGAVALEPFPLTVERLEISVPARRIPAHRYADDADLRHVLATAPTERLFWRLQGG